MRGAEELVACPACRAPLSAEWGCTGCGALYVETEGVLNLRLPSDDRTEVVRRFYETAPFPGYPPSETLETLHLRADRSPFSRLLDRAIPADARVVDVGCGSGQMCLYLAHADRVIIGADVARASLRLGAAAAFRFGLDRVQFVETDLRQPGLMARAFDVVYSSGVLHHTADPRAAFAQLVPLARPGGIIVLGLYHWLARLPTRARRVLGRLSGFRFLPGDPILADRATDPARRTAWLRDQYQHPEEHRHSFPEVRRWFNEERVTYLRSYPSVMWDDEPDDLFSPAADHWVLERWLTQLGWMGTLGREGGLFFMVGRRA